MKIYLNGSKLRAEGELLVVVLQYSLNFWKLNLRINVPILGIQRLEIKGFGWNSILKYVKLTWTDCIAPVLLLLLFQVCLSLFNLCSPVSFLIPPFKTNNRWSTLSTRLVSIIVRNCNYSQTCTNTPTYNIVLDF